MKEITEEMIGDLAHEYVFNENGHKWSNNDNTAGDNFGSFMAGFKAAQEQLKPEWVPVSERLPEIGQYVQAAIKGGVLLYSCVLEKNNTWYGYGYAQPETRITHWMPLPAPPKQ
jgi:hypothetical protein